LLTPSAALINQRNWMLLNQRFFLDLKERKKLIDIKENY
jgi:hypothetical protein